MYTSPTSKETLGAADHTDYGKRGEIPLTEMISLLFRTSLAMQFQRSDACAVFLFQHRDWNRRQSSSGKQRFFWGNLGNCILDVLDLRMWGLIYDIERIIIGSLWVEKHNRYCVTFTSRAQVWPMGTNHFQRKVCSLFGYFLPTLMLFFSPGVLQNTVCIDWSICFTNWDTPWIRLTVFYGMPRVQHLMNSPLWANFITWLPSPTRRSEWGRRRTCLREMCWLKSIEVEDKKIIWRKVAHYFGIF